MKTPRHSVSDFALLEFLEVEHGIDIATLRRTVAWRADAAGAVTSEPGVLTSHRLRLHVSGGTVCSVQRSEAGRE